MQLKSVKQVSLKNKRVLYKVDYNVPLKNNLVRDDNRIKLTLPTLHYLIQQKAKVVILTHVGRPNGKQIKSLSVKPIAKYLSQVIKQQAKIINFPINQKDVDFTHSLKPGQVAIFENTRFHPQEKTNGKTYSKQLASLGDLIVFDAFASAHRNHASVSGVAKHLPMYAGFYLGLEIKMLEKLSKNPKKPLVIIVGGSKVKGKTQAIKNFTKIADQILVGGKTANFMLDKKFKHPKVILPTDFIGDRFDIGPETIKLFKSHIKTAKTIFFIGPLGWFEKDKYANGTKQISQAIIKSKALTIAGGGDTIAALHKFNLSHKFDFLSAAGGASLDFLAGKTLPGLKPMIAK